MAGDLRRGQSETKTELLRTVTDLPVLRLNTACTPTALPYNMSCAKSATRSKMGKKTRDIGAEILQGLRELKRGQFGRVMNVPDIAKIRKNTGLSQGRFAQLLGVSVRTLQDWEQGRRAPSGAARTLLAIAAKNPKL